MSDPYNPLEKINLADSIEREILKQEPISLMQMTPFNGAGVYLLYYDGSLPLYQALKPSVDSWRPIYVGRAIPKGARIGGLSSKGAKANRALYGRLAKHRSKIAASSNLDPADFKVRWLVVDDIWIPLGENAIIEKFEPLWNIVVAGFGNNPVGSGRRDQKLSLWDVLHPPREVGAGGRAPLELAVIEQRVAAFLRGEDVPKSESRDPIEDDENDD